MRSCRPLAAKHWFGFHWAFALLGLAASLSFTPRASAAPLEFHIPTSPPLHTSTLSLSQTPALPDSHTDLPPLCPSLYQLQHPGDCPDLGPGAYARQLVAGGMTYPLPSLEIVAERPYGGLTPHAYARIITDTAPVFRSPFDALAG